MPLRTAFVALLVLNALALEAHAQITARVVLQGLSEPVAFVQDPTDARVQFVVERGGRIRVVVNGALQATDFLTLTASEVTAAGEGGLLGLAFDPDYAANRRFYVNFTRPAAGKDWGDTVVARFKRSVANPRVADKSTRVDFRWLSIPGQPAFIEQPYSNHNGGHIAFGPDGYLYIAMGDGGGGNDLDNRAQDRLTLLGKMLRLDVDVPDTHPNGYQIPLDNPFVDNDPVDAYEEIWSFGWRNPWRFSFDDVARGGTGALIAGDVGQGSREEIDYEPRGKGGRNYGWRIREGFIATPGVPVTTPAFLPLADPVFDYGRTSGQSVTGGFVYRGTALGAAYVGRYFFADFIAGRVWSIVLTIDASTLEAQYAPGSIIEHTSDIQNAIGVPIGNISSFGVDAYGELYLTSFNGRVIALGPPPLILALSTTAGGAVRVTPPGLDCTSANCGLFLPVNATVALTATAGAGRVFAGWTGDEDCLDGVVTMTGHRSCAAVFQTVQGAAPVRAIDFNGNGTADVFLYDPTTGAWRMGLSESTQFQSIAGVWGAGWSVMPARLNNDSFGDLLLYHAPLGVWVQGLSVGGGQFVYTTDFAPKGLRPFAARLNDDMLDDLLLYDPMNGAVIQYFTDGAGSFSSTVAVQWPLSAGPAWSIQRARLDGNARDDFFLYHSASGAWHSFISNGSGGFTSSTGVTQAGFTVTIGDFNGDQIDDVFLYNAQAGGAFQCLNQSNGSYFQCYFHTWTPGWTAYRARLNGDVTDDLFAYNAQTGVWFFCYTNGSGGFTYVPFDVPWAPGWEINVVDFNRDGVEDLFLYHPAVGLWYQALTLPQGRFAYYPGFTAAGMIPYANR